MPARVPHRPAESRVVEDFVASAAVGPSALVIGGEGGIGKTTVWLAAVEDARARGSVVLQARPSAAEATLAYSSIADLLRGVGPDRLDRLPPPQRLAVSRVLQLAGAAEGPTDPQAIGAAVLTLVEDLAAEGPVLLAVDDAQWLDASSAALLGFVCRRVAGPVGVLVTVRTGPDLDDPSSWLALPRPDSVTRVDVPPLGLGALHAVLAERLGRTFPRPVMTRIHAVSGGNPFYALELGRVGGGSPEQLPATRGDVLRGRLDGVGERLGDLCLAVASLADATVEVAQAACGFPDDEVLALVDEAEERGLLVVDGHRLRFAHPLLAAAVLRDAGPPVRRRMHRRLAAVVDEPEQRARHLALAAVRADPGTLAALDTAAVLARGRGAPAAAAELVDLAIGLGGSTVERKLQAALHHFDAGDTERARGDLEGLARELLPVALRARVVSQLGLVRLHDDSFVEAAALLAEALADVGDDLRLRVQTLVWLSYAEVNVGRFEAAAGHAAAAVGQGERLGDRHLLSQAVTLRAVLRFIGGGGLDERELDRAGQLAAGSPRVPVPFRADTQRVLLRAWTGELAPAAAALRALRRACLEHGEENELVFLDFHSVLVAVWRGEFAEAAELAEECMERALHLHADVPLAVAHSVRGLAATYIGDVERAVADTTEALDVYQRCGWSTLAEWPMATLGLLHVSTGDHRAALSSLEPLVARARSGLVPGEIISSSFVPDAVEALVQLGRLEEAERLVTPLELAGRRLDRPWTRATAARCRSLVLAARGQLDEAWSAAEQAMVQHDRVLMPFERARTLLVLGVLQRRRRKKAASGAALREAAEAFGELGAGCGPTGRSPNWGG